MISLEGENHGKNPHSPGKQKSLELTLFSGDITFPISLFIYKEVARLNDLLCTARDARGTSAKAEGGRIFVTAFCANMLVIITVHYY